MPFAPVNLKNNGTQLIVGRYRFVKGIGKAKRPSNITLKTATELYIESVKLMKNKRPNTVSNRFYGAQKLADFVMTDDPELKLKRFNQVWFDAYADWLKAVPMANRKGHYSGQSILNFVRGARVFFRWAVDQGYMPKGPKEPEVKVGKRPSRHLTMEEVKASC